MIVNDFQIIPVPDSIPHDIDATSADCICGPQVSHNREDGIPVVQHFALVTFEWARWVIVAPGAEVEYDLTPVAAPAPVPERPDLSQPS